MKTTQVAPEPKPKSQRPRCLYCTKKLEPVFEQPKPPAKLLDGRKRRLREEWEQAHPLRFTGRYGRLADDRFCGTSCGYNWAVAHTKGHAWNKLGICTACKQITGREDEVCKGA